jgi:hypothetical protein
MDGNGSELCARVVSGSLNSGAKFLANFRLANIRHPVIAHASARDLLIVVHPVDLLHQVRHLT